MHTSTLSGIVKRRFIFCYSVRHQTVQEIIELVGVPAVHFCHVIAGTHPANLPLRSYYRLACWLNMTLANVLALARYQPKLEDLICLSMEVQGMRPSSCEAQIIASRQAGISVAVFRRALHGYADFSPSRETCLHLAHWMAWTGLDLAAIAASAGMTVRYEAGRGLLIHSPSVERVMKPFPCACGRPGCMVPAHIPNGPRRKWRSDACRMWAKRKEARTWSRSHPSPLPCPVPIVRFITINERVVPARF